MIFPLTVSFRGMLWTVTEFDDLRVLMISKDAADVQSRRTKKAFEVALERGVMTIVEATE